MKHAMHATLIILLFALAWMWIPCSSYDTRLDEVSGELNEGFALLHDLTLRSASWSQSRARSKSWGPVQRRVRRFTSTDDNVILKTLNDIRRQVQAADMQYVKLDSQLESFSRIWTTKCNASYTPPKSTYMNQSLMGVYSLQPLTLAAAAQRLFTTSPNNVKFLYANIHAVGCSEADCKSFKVEKGRTISNVSLYACIIGFKQLPVACIMGDVCSQCPQTHPNCDDGLCREANGEIIPRIFTPPEERSTIGLSKSSERPGIASTISSARVSSRDKADGEEENDDADNSDDANFLSSTSSISIIIGVACGVGLLFIIFLISVVYVVVCARRKKRRPSNSTENHLHTDTSSPHNICSVSAMTSEDTNGGPPPYSLMNHLTLSSPPPYTNSSAPSYSLRDRPRDVLILSILVPSAPLKVDRYSKDSDAISLHDLSSTGASSSQEDSVLKESNIDLENSSPRSASQNSSDLRQAFDSNTSEIDNQN